mmetsp:Transcript_96860/g.273762  ORF Transcript_96860/g.273762 Transcript_96860/m.273762 type:complete len:468 (+) Transcript_96860:103-1506(+)
MRQHRLRWARFSSLALINFAAAGKSEPSLGGSQAVTAAAGRALDCEILRGAIVPDVPSSTCCELLRGFTIGVVARSRGSQWHKLALLAGVKTCSVAERLGSCSDVPELVHAADDATMSSMRGQLCREISSGCNTSRARTAGFATALDYIFDATTFTAALECDGPVDLCGHSCRDVIMPKPTRCFKTWADGCGETPPPQGFSAMSTLESLCPLECWGGIKVPDGQSACETLTDPGLCQAVGCCKWEEGRCWSEIHDALCHEGCAYRSVPVTMHHACVASANTYCDAECESMAACDVGTCSCVQQPLSALVPEYETFGTCAFLAEDFRFVRLACDESELVLGYYEDSTCSKPLEGLPEQGIRRPTCTTEERIVCDAPTSTPTSTPTLAPLSPTSAPTLAPTRAPTIAPSQPPSSETTQGPFLLLYYPSSLASTTAEPLEDEVNAATRPGPIAVAIEALLLTFFARWSPA